MQKKFYFTNAKLKALKPHDPNSPSTELEISDSKITGLKLLVGKTGNKRFLLRYTFQSRKRSIAIGKFGDIDVVTARKIAKKYRAQIAGGTDPKAERDSYRHIPTVSEFFWGTYHAVIKANKLSWRKDVQRFEKFIEPRIGAIRYSELKPIDVLHLQQYIADPSKANRAYAPSTNNRIIAVVKTMTSYALKLGIVKNNVATPIGLLKEDNIREKFFDINDSKKIIEAALDYPNPYIGSAIAMLYICGNRKSEIYGLKWSNFDRKNKSIFVEHSKSGKSFYIHLSELAFNIIDKLEPKEGNPYIFVGRKRGQPIKEVRVAYSKILNAAGITDLKDVCFHTARHSVASNMISSGLFSQVHVKQQLAHASIQSSERYMHHTPQSARNISQGFSDLLEDKDNNEN
ncbi:tyrosine-type recombinase/integrase [Aliikangiella sp. IMCC44359]|uniref:tyrosine-type recombinase/integrase n=1 Tax=Aliikangiella sp. IMCC44359 TaxID=3459125 RepID=UPI00403B2688